MAGQYQDRQDSKLYGSRLIIHRRVDLDNDNFYFRAKVDGHTGYIRRSCQTSDVTRAMIVAEDAYEELRVRAFKQGQQALQKGGADVDVEDHLKRIEQSLDYLFEGLIKQRVQIGSGVAVDVVGHSLTARTLN